MFEIGKKDEMKLVLMKLYNIKVKYISMSSEKNVSNGNLHVPVHSSLLEELVGLLICASYIARSAPGLGQLQHPLAFSGTSHIFQLQLHLGSPHSGHLTLF